MKRLKAIEKRGYKVTIFASGNGTMAQKGNTKIIGNSITDLYNKIVKP